MNNDATDDLITCPRCRSGETRWEFKHLPPRMRGPGALISATIYHFCPRLDGCQNMMTKITGRTREDVVKAWNSMGKGYSMSEFKQYRRKQVAEIRPYVVGEALSDRVSISPADREAGSPKPGDMIARNPKSHDDQWLIAADYFKDNFDPL